MKKTLLLTAVVVLAAAAAIWNFGPRDDTGAPAEAGTSATTGTSPSTPSYPIGSDTVPQPRTLEEAKRVESFTSATRQAQPPQTYVGPDGKEHAIVYNQGLNLDSQETRQLEREIIRDMRAHPEVFVGLHGLEMADVEAIVAGKKRLPRELLSRIVM